VCVSFLCFILFHLSLIAPLHLIFLLSSFLLSSFLLSSFLIPSLLLSPPLLCLASSPHPLIPLKHLTLQTIVNHVLLWGSVVVAFAFNYTYTAIYTPLLPETETYWVMQRASTRAEFWFLLLLTPMVALLPR